MSVVRTFQEKVDDVFHMAGLYHNIGFHWPSAIRKAAEEREDLVDEELKLVISMAASRRGTRGSAKADQMERPFPKLQSLVRRRLMAMMRQPGLVHQPKTGRHAPRNFKLTAG